MFNMRLQTSKVKDHLLEIVEHPQCPINWKTNNNGLGHFEMNCIFSIEENHNYIHYQDTIPCIGLFGIIGDSDELW